ncbi:MAG TPA: ADYC domain-containing protein [Polyangiaceae bacterium]|nr:ADYC domain-containing protein [Polyangiaceae bacterium]
MGKRNQLIRLVAVAFAFLTGCAPEAPPGESGESALGPDLEALPGGELGAQDIATNGTLLNGIATNGTELAGVAVTGVGVNATVFTGRTIDGTPMSGPAFVGTTMNGIKPDNTVLKIRIDAMTALPAPNADLYGYTVSFDGVNGAKEYICGLDPAGQPVQAIPIMGTWNYGQGVTGGGSFTPSTTMFTFACRGMAIGKCIELGYRPWQAIAGGGTLQNHLNACTRALRADYCGNGKSYTLNGTVINLYDVVSVQADTESWPVEAEWTANGARFITTGTKKRYKLLGGDPPPCANQLESASTGNLANFSSGTLIMTEYTNDLLLTPPPRSGSRPPPPGAGVARGAPYVLEWAVRREG